MAGGSFSKYYTKSKKALAEGNEQKNDAGMKEKSIVSEANVAELSAENSKKGNVAEHSAETSKKKKSIPDDDVTELPSMSAIRLRTTPSLFKTVISLLSDSQKDAVRSFGFGSLLDFDIGGLPSKLCHYVVENFDSNEMVIKLMKGKITVDCEAVHEVLGIPMGGTTISEEKIVNSDFLKGWLAQFPPPEKKPKKLDKKSVKKSGKKREQKTDDVLSVRPNHIASKITENNGELNEYFKMNFFMLFMSSLIYSDHNGAACLDTLYRVNNDCDVSNLDWCTYVLEFIERCKCWAPNNYSKHYHGPATLLTLLYLDRTEFEPLTVVRTRPIFKNWSRFLDAREHKEIELGRFGTMPIRPPYDAYDDIKNKLTEISNLKKILFEVFDKEKEKDPKNPISMFYHSKLKEVFSMDSVFYDGEKPNEVEQLNEGGEKAHEGGNSSVDVVDNVLVDHSVEKQDKASVAEKPELVHYTVRKKKCARAGRPPKVKEGNPAGGEVEKIKKTGTNGDEEQVTDDHDRVDDDDVGDAVVLSKKGRGGRPLKRKEADFAGDQGSEKKIKNAGVNVPTRRKHSERILKRKISANVVTKDGKGLQKDKPVTLN